MKTRVSGLFMLIATVGLSQTKTAYREPEYNDQAYGYAKAEVPLEKKEIYLQSNDDVSQALIGIGKTKKIAFVEGKKSSARFTSSDTIRIVINTGDNKIDPKEFIGIARMEINEKKERRFVVYGQSFAGVTNNKKSKVDTMVMYEARKFGATSYLITILPLQPGEYGIGTQSTNFHLFGVD